MSDDPNVYKMRPGVYVEDKPVKELAEELFSDDPLIKDYTARIHETEGSKKNHLYFDYTFIDFERIRDEFDPEDHGETNKKINRYLREITERTAEMRRDDL